VTRYPKLSFIIAEYSWEKRAANDVMFDLANKRGLGTFIWEPLQYEEAFFTQSGTKWTTNSLIDLYPTMSKDYGNDTVTTMARDWTPQVKRSAYDTPWFSRWISGFTPYPEDNLTHRIYDGAGRLIGSVGARAWPLSLSKGAVPRSLPAGLYFVWRGGQLK
jgi:hypothetical protein